MSIGNIIVVLVIIFVSLMMIIVFSDIMLAPNIDGDDLFKFESAYCDKYNMSAVRYVERICGFFCSDGFNKVKCTNGIDEIKIDYSDDLFCYATIKNNLGLC